MHVPHYELQCIALSVLVCDPFNFNYSPKYENTIWLLLKFIKKKKMEVRKTLGEKEADDEKGRPLDLSPTLPPGVGALPTKTAPIRENSAAEKHPYLF